jgi:hypothetical protein
MSLRNTFYANFAKIRESQSRQSILNKENYDEVLAYLSTGEINEHSRGRKLITQTGKLGIILIYKFG